MKAIILSGGTGTRLRPLTYSCAKQLLPVANKPTLFYILDKIAAAGIKDIGIIVGDTHEEIKAAVGKGERWNVNVTYIRQQNPLGLAHAVKTASDYLKDDDFLMILGDNLFHMELNEMIEYFYSSGSNAVLLLHRMENPSQFGVAVVEKQSIVRLVEKPAEPISNLIITGVYIFDKSIFHAIENIRPSARGELEITDAVQNLLETGGIVSYSLTRGWWKDMGNQSEILEANRLVLDEIEKATNSMPDSSSHCKGQLSIGQNVKIKNSIINGPVIIGENSFVVDSQLGPYVSLGKNVKIENCKIENSIILEGTILQNVGKKISNSLIGANSSIRGSSTAPSHLCLLLGENSEIWL